MANGHPDFEIEQLPRLERFFSVIAQPLEQFASRHRLRLVKYENTRSSWDFVFRHPAGGVAQIQVLPHTDDDVLIVAHWEITDLTAFRRSTLSMDRGAVRREDPRLPGILDSLLDELVKLPASRLVPDGVDYRPYWRTNVMQQIEASRAALPLPLL
jgi:hypothetical protein